MRPVMFLLLCATLLLAAGCGSDSSASEDIVAIVDGEEITALDLDRELRSRIDLEADVDIDTQFAPEEIQDLKLQLLNQLINDRILLAMAERAGLTASDGEVDLRFTEFRSQFTDEEFQELMSEQQITQAEIRDEIRKTLSVEKLVNREISSKVTVSSAEIQEFYDKNMELFDLPEGHHIAHILVTPFPSPELPDLPDDATNAAEALQKAQRLLRDVRGGRDFAVVARESSEDPGSAPNGGDLGFQAIDAIASIDPQLAAAVERLRVGETAAQLVQTAYGYHIVKLINRDPGGQKDLTDPRVQAQIRQVIIGRKEQLYRAAFAETARNDAQITNYFARRILEQAGATQ